jgi:hypothetical protein
MISLLLGAALSVTCAKAAPKIEISPTTYNCGSFNEGKVDKLKAAFIVKNTGDAVLHIDEVRPGCGCTVVEFDSLVAPGKTGVINASVNLANIHTGDISKTISVRSNAANEESIMLTITATIHSLIDISDQYVNVSSNTKTPTILYLSSLKKNLNITEITFKSSIAKKDAPGWQQEMPIVVHYKWSPTDSVRADGYKVFKLELFKPSNVDGDYGEMTIKTNHPEKSNIVIQANIVK